jgi:hypothetical protein
MSFGEGDAAFVFSTRAHPPRSIGAINGEIGVIGVARNVEGDVSVVGVVSDTIVVLNNGNHDVEVVTKDEVGDIRGIVMVRKVHVDTRITVEIADDNIDGVIPGPGLGLVPVAGVGVIGIRAE